MYAGKLIRTIGMLAAAATLGVLAPACGDDDNKGKSGGSGGATGGTGGGTGGGAGGSTGGTGGTGVPRDGGVDAAGGGSGGAGGAGAGGTGGARDGGTPDVSRDAAPAVTANTRCTFGPAVNMPLMGVAANREVLCAIDLGSSNAKLAVMSWEKDKTDTLKDERQCSNRLQLGAITFDRATMMARPLPADALANLVLVIKQFQGICMMDKAKVVGIEATQWARDATNQMQIKETIKKETGLDLEILTTVQEGQLGYVTATYGRPGKLAIDPGSNSFQLSWQETGMNTAIRTVSVPFGHQRGAEMYYPPTTMDTYDAARAKHAADLKMRLDAELAKLMPPTNLMAIKALVTSNKVAPQLFAAGQDAAIKLAVSGSLKPMGKWVDSQMAYDELVRMQMSTAMPMLTPGYVAALLTPADLTKWFTDVVKTAEDFMTLRTMPVRDIYGSKSLANAVLFDFLAKELGITQMVMVPQELAMGYIIWKATNLKL